MTPSLGRSERADASLRRAAQLAESVLVQVEELEHGLLFDKRVRPMAREQASGEGGGRVEVILNFCDREFL